MNKLIDWLLLHFPCFASHTIGAPGKPYLLRKYLLPKRYTGARWPGVFLHRFYSSDEDRRPHNHPWKFAISLILTGGYMETRFDPKKHNGTGGEWRYHMRRPWSFNVIRSTDYHRAELLDPRGCWTLFVAFGHKPAEEGSEWGFIDPDTGVFTGWREYLPQGADGLEGD
jgi:hypothetical protein